MSDRARIAIASLTLSAAGLIALVSHEGYRDKAYIPVPGDRPTVGFGSTFNPDGSPVKMGDTTTPQKALRMSLAHIGKDELQLKRCVYVPLYQHEYDAYVSLAYNIGTDSFCKSTLARVLNSGDYEGACLQILRWNVFKGKPSRGLTKRRQFEYEICTGGGQR